MKASLNSKILFSIFERVTKWPIDVASNQNKIAMELEEEEDEDSGFGNAGRIMQVSLSLIP